MVTGVGGLLAGEPTGNQESSVPRGTSRWGGVGADGDLLAGERVVASGFVERARVRGTCVASGFVERA